MKGPTSPLLGFNNNVRYKGRVFHIQTEDSGVRHPHVITHLFMDGGRILKTTKTSYAEHVGAANGQETVRQLMRSQHEAMFKALRAGEYDAIIAGKLAGEKPAEAAPSGRPSEKAPDEPPAKAAEPPTTPNSVPPPSAQSVPPPRLDPARRTDPTAATAPAQPAIRLEDIPKVVIPTKGKSKPPPKPRTPSTPPVELEVEHIERAAHASHTPHPRAKSDSPLPPPAVLSTSKPDGGYREVSDRQREPDPGSGRGSRPAVSSRPAASSRASSSKDAPRSSIFGDDMISEKSLDEVILSYLAEDLDGTAPPKK